MSTRQPQPSNGIGFVKASHLLNNDHDAAPREEPYLEPTHLDKPILEIYDPETTDGRVLLEEPDNSWAWIRTRKRDLVDVEGYR